MSDVNLFILGTVVFVLAGTGGLLYVYVLFQRAFARENPMLDETTRAGRPRPDAVSEAGTRARGSASGG